VKLLCRVLDVSKSGYYAWRKRQPSRRAQTEPELVTRIRAIYQQHRRTYGSPRITAELRATATAGQRYNPKRIARLMRQKTWSRHYAANKTDSVD
jgi:hypothetical protein